MRRVWVIGASGSGKTTLAEELARRLGVPHIELDAMHHGPDWAEPDLDEFREAVAAVASGDAWVIDGSYRSKLGDRVPDAADTLVWLDLPLPVTLSRMLWRSGVRIWRGTELWNGNRESVRGVLWGRESLLWWSVARRHDQRTELPELFAKPGYAEKTIVRLRSASQVEHWLSAVVPVAQPPAGGS
jgi:adenylate kinase family enzyme